MGKNIHSGHRQRVRERYLSEGLDSFEDHQVLELLLFYCYPQRNTNEIAHRMLDEFGNLRALFEADPLEISSRCQVSENVGVFISVISSLMRRYLSSRSEKKIILDSSRKVGEYAVSLFVGRTVETLFMLCLNTGLQLLHTAKLSEGSIGEAHVYIREFVETALKYKASRVVLTHNHPGGSLSASANDISSTDKIMKALDTVNIDVLDHIIVSGDAYMSFSEEKTPPFGRGN
ncbi:MAG: hypothetical protein LBS62_08815 [Clostridiales bacterium]|nr:hypothetical protein [Clostridiales bacterium]